MAFPLTAPYEGSRPIARFATSTAEAASCHRLAIFSPVIPLPALYSEKIGRLADYRVSRKLGEEGRGLVFETEDVRL